MGITLSKCVNLAGQTVYLEETYTVIRTSGEKQDGWLLTEKIHRCINTAGHQRPAAHALLKDQGWSVHLHNGDQDEEHEVTHACGWRRLGTFWPTRLTGNQEAIDTWTLVLRDTLEQLAAEQGLPDTWAEHQCGRGSPQEMCDACCAQRRADEKKKLFDERAQIREQKDAFRANQEPHLPSVMAEWDELDRREREINAALDKMPSAAKHRAWLAWREKQSELKREESAGGGAAAREELDAALEALGAKPYHPVYAPLERGPDDVVREYEVLKAKLDAARAVAAPTRAQIVQRNRLEGEFVDLEKEYTQVRIWQLEAEEVDVSAQHRIALHSERDASWGERCGVLNDKLVALSDELLRLRSALEEMPRRAVFVPVPPPADVRLLPAPLSDMIRKRIRVGVIAPEAPTEHGCAYADSDCPWSICYACEYERDPAAYQTRVRHSELVEQISAYWRSPRHGEKAKGWATSTLEDVVHFLDTPREDRRFTDEQVCDKELFSCDWGSRDASLLAALRELHGVA